MRALELTELEEPFAEVRRELVDDRDPSPSPAHPPLADHLDAALGLAGTTQRPADVTTPEHAVEPGGGVRNWDYRYCWLRDAYYVVQALNRLGAADMLENYLAYLRNLVDQVGSSGHVQPVYGVGLEPVLTERIAPDLPGYRGMGPVRVGNQAHEHMQ